jgi:selenocysteine-specific elongation factor
MHVIATAGHVDHGKSTLLRALTGMEPDRWAEERRRGMTIDLGYAWTVLPNGETVAFVDVPGHERFVGNMLAGLGPVPAAMLVVAADQGWCRQTAEHVVALQALGVRHGILVISRADLGDAALAAEETHDYLAGTALASMETVAVSAVTGTGLPGLRAALSRLAAAIPAPPRDRPARLWVDRAFTIRGAGTVVTGTLGSGELATGDEMLLVPSGAVVRVRKMESLRETIGRATAVARVAVNIRGLAKDDVHRGNALVTPSMWTAVNCMDVRLTCAGEHIPGHLTLHAGSAAVPVRARMLGADTARLTLASPLPLQIGERALLRDPGQQRIIAGAIILDTAPPPLRRRGGAAARARQLAGMSGKADLAGELKRRGVVSRKQLVAMGVIAPRQPIDEAVTVGDWLVHQRQWGDWGRDLHSAVDQWAAGRPMTPGMPRDAAARRLGLPDRRLLDALVARSGDLVSDAEGVHRAGVSVSLTPEAERALAVIRERLAAEPFAAPEAQDLAELGLTVKDLAAAAKKGLMVRLAADIYLLPDAADIAVRRLRLLPRPFTVSDGRKALRTTRRVAIPLFEFLDRTGHTRRVSPGERIVLDAGRS